MVEPQSGEESQADHHHHNHYQPGGGGTGRNSTHFQSLFFVGPHPVVSGSRQAGKKSEILIKKDGRLPTESGGRER
jgi:hypothetical protein